jgi:hypothetical protein
MDAPLPEGKLADPCRDLHRPRDQWLPPGRVLIRRVPQSDQFKSPALAGLLFGVPNMNDSLEVEVLYPA